MKASPFPSLMKPIASIVSAGLLSLNNYDVAVADNTPTLTLEQSIVSLEDADTRPKLLQAMADVFETSNSRSLQARTKYKQVYIM